MTLYFFAAFHLTAELCWIISNLKDTRVFLDLQQISVFIHKCKMLVTKSESFMEKGANLNGIVFTVTCNILPFLVFL